jgi:thiamine transport system substrate-binding protein
MQSSSDPVPTPRRQTRRPIRLVVAATVALLLVLAGYATYAYVLYPGRTGATTIVVYSYPSLLGGCAGNVTTGLLHDFTAETGIGVDLECPAGTLISTLLAEKNSPRADVVVGLDEVTAPEAEANGLLVPYVPPGFVHVNGSLAADLSTDHAVTPYEWGYLAFDYNLSFDAATHGAVRTAGFENYSANASWASALMVEDPTVDITGEEFLLWEIAYFSQVAHAPWQTWWQAVDPHVRVAPDWTDAYDAFSTPPNNPGVIVSYSVDPATQAFYGEPPTFNSTVAWSAGVAYGWKTVYGLGIVHGSPHMAADEAFINWFLSGEVQQQIPTNEWEYPANATIARPGVFNYSVDPARIVPLNGALPPATIVTSLATWLDDWQSIANQYG